MLGVVLILKVGVGVTLKVAVIDGVGDGVFEILIEGVTLGELLKEGVGEGVGKKKEDNL